jgi:hypothetical protein
MGKIRWSVAAWALLAAGLAAGTNQRHLPMPGLAGIEGTVIDMGGKPISEAKVCAEPTGLPMSGRVPCTVTDEKGQFFLGFVTPGRNTIYAYKTAAGYPSPAYAFFSGPPDSTLNLEIGRGKVASGLVLKLGPKGAWLSGRVVDAGTGRAVSSAQIILRREDDPRIYYSAGPSPQGGTFDFLVPPVRFTITVSAHGYAPWYYGKDGTQEGALPLRMAPGTTKEFIIRLRPLKAAGD